MNQQQWEMESYAEGMDKFFDNEQQARRDGNTDGTAVGSSVIRQRVEEIGIKIADEASRRVGGKGGAYVQALRVAAARYSNNELQPDYNMVGYIGLLTLLQASYAKNDRGKYLLPLTKEIGRRLEFDQKLHVFRMDNPAFVGKIELSLAQQGVTSLSHKLKTYQKKWRDAEMKWEEWGSLKQTQVGIRVVRCILDAMDDCFALTKKHNGRHMAYYVDTTLAFDDFVIDETDLISKTMPIMRPLLETPIPWQRCDGEIAGGFHTPELRRAAPFIKTKGKAHAEFVEAAYPHKHITAVNHMQETKWEVNTKLKEYVQGVSKRGWDGFEIPRLEKLPLPEHPGDDADKDMIEMFMLDSKRVHGKNKHNSVELIVMAQSMRMADMLAGVPFCFVYTCDFRGRIYCTSTTLSPQGPDHIKSMIQFANGKPLTREGVRWLAINGANKYGTDKVNYHDRVRWIMDQRQAIEEFVSEPYSSRSRSFIAGADKPFQFAAFCYEWAESGYGTNPDYISHLPIGLDGSCNGLQHYGALLLDPVGGSGVNLTVSELPADIYGEVATEFRRLLDGTTDPMASQILALCPDRKATKRPVMTLPYGSTQQSCRMYLMDWLDDQLPEADNKTVWALAIYGTPILWEAIGNVVIAARAAMEWLQKCSTIIAGTGVYARWLSPADFPVYQHYSEYVTTRVATDLFGEVRIRLNLNTDEVAGIQKVRARNGIAPNFVHAMDASHMVMAILEAAERGIDDMSLIHDDFGVHACDTPQFFEVIRQTFVQMYYDRDWLLAWKREIERLDDSIELPDPPEQGTLDILQVLDSPYFFG